MFGREKKITDSIEKLFTSDSNNVITNAIEWSNFRYSFYSNRNTSAVFIFTGTHYVIKSMGSGLNLDQVIYD